MLKALPPLEPSPLLVVGFEPVVWPYGYADGLREHKRL